MASCRIVDAAVSSAVTEISDIAGQYETVGKSFIENFNSAIAEMEGETKDALKNFVNSTVQEFVETNIPKAIDGMAQLLEANRTNFINVDLEIAQQIGEG